MKIFIEYIYKLAATETELGIELQILEFRIIRTFVPLRRDVIWAMNQLLQFNSEILAELH